MVCVRAVGRWAVATVAGVVLAGSGAGTVAAAAAPPTITSYGCEGSGGRYFCFVSWTGGTAPVSIRWFYNGSPAAAFDDRSFFLRTCNVGTVATIRVVVSHAGGADEDSKVVPCTLLLGT